MKGNTLYVSTMNEVMNAMDQLATYNFGLACDPTGYMLTGYEELAHSVDELTFYLTPALYQRISPAFKQEVYAWHERTAYDSLYDKLQQLQTIENRKLKINNLLS